MTTPNTSISSLAMSDVNVELSYDANNALAMNDGIFRSLTGLANRQIANTVVNMSDLSNKTAFGGIISANSSNVISYGVIEREINMLANTDMYDCTVVWTATPVSGAVGVLTQNNKQASYKVTGVQEQNVTANVFVTATLSYKGHEIGVASKYISFTINSLPPMLFVNGNTNVESVKFEPTSIATTLTASANAPGAQMLFRVDPMDAGVLISGNTVSLSAQAQMAGTDNVRNYSVLTELVFNNQIIAQDLKNVTLRALYAVPDINLTVPATTNNVFANVGLVRSSLTVSGSHNVPGANLTWTATKVSGDDAALIVAPDQGSANLTVSIADGLFGARKSVYDVTAALAYANGQPITSKTTRLTLRTAAYGLSFNSANVTQSGYTSQTAVGAIYSTYQAGTLTWAVARVSGDTAVFNTSAVNGSGVASFNLSTDNVVGTKNSVYRATATLTYDGVTMISVPTDINLIAQQNAYSFSLSGPTVNTQVGEAPVSASIVTTASHNIPGGTVTFTKTTSPATMTSNTTAAVVSYSNNTIGTDTYTLSVQLKDANGRNVETRTSAQTLRAYAPNLRFIGANSVSRTGFSDQSASLSANAVVSVAGANSLSVTAQLLVGSTLGFSTSGNTTLQTATLSTSRTTIGTNESTYRLTATVNYFGVLYSQTFDATLSVTKDDAQFTLSGAGQSLSSFNFPVVANGTVTASHVIPGGTITWSSAGTGTVSNVAVSNATSYVFQTIQGSVGTAAANQTITATLRDSAGAFVDSKSVTANTSATVNNPALVLNGPASNVVSNTFHAEAQVITTPSVAAGLTGHTYQFNAVATSGSAQASSNSSAVLLRNVFDGAGEARGVYNVICNVVLNGQVIASTYKSVTVAAVCPAPVLEYAGNPNASSGSFNFPVNNWAWFDAATTPAGGTFSWSWNLVAGVNATNIYTENNNSRLVIQNSQSNYGGQTSTYDVTCTYRTPNGTVLGQRTQRISTYSERYNPNLSLNYVNGNSATVSGFAERLDAAVAIQASTHPALGGHQFRITPVFVGGNFNQADFNLQTGSGYMSASLYNVRSVNGTNPKAAQYDFYVDVVLNGQVISGQAVLRTYHQINPGAIYNPGDIWVSSFVWNGTAAATLSFNPNGNFYQYGNGTLTGTWMSPSDPGEAANYEIRFQNNQAFQPLDASRQVSISVSGSPERPRAQQQSGYYMIRNRWNGVVVAQGNWTLEVSVGQLV